MNNDPDCASNLEGEIEYWFQKDLMYWFSLTLSFEGLELR